MEKKKVDCIVKLRAPPGFQVAVNFIEMDIMEDINGGCLQDFVKIYEENNIITSSLLGNIPILLEKFF